MGGCLCNWTEADWIRLAGCQCKDGKHFLKSRRLDQAA